LLADNILALFEADSLCDRIPSCGLIWRESRLICQRFDEPHCLDPLHLAHRCALFVQYTAHGVCQALASTIDRTADAAPLFEAMSEGIAERSAHGIELRPLQNGRPTNHSPSGVQVSRREPTG